LKRHLGTLAIAGALLGGLLVSPVAATAAPEKQAAPAAAGIKWGPCTSASLKQAGAQCGFLQVPLDYSKPGGAKISLAVSRIKHTVPDAKYQGVMLTNPGGPGGSGLGLPLINGLFPKKAGAAYDWIGFDPRGVGSSKPSLSCIKDYAGYDRPPYIPTTGALERIWLQRSKGYANACGKNGGALLNHLKTTDSARDMEEIRKALGAKQINYYGYSYGTYLGQVYATLFGDKIRRMVLDSNVDPRKVWYQANLDQDVAFDRNINIWFDWLAKNDKVFHLGTSRAKVSQTFYATRDKLDKKAAGGVIGGDEWTDIFLNAGYYKVTWVDLGNLFANYIATGDYKPLQQEFAPNLESDNGYAIYSGVQCSDVQWPKSWAQWRSDNWRIHAIAPFETWANAWFNAPCVFWPAKAGTPVNVNGSKVKSGLLVDGTLDAATPYQGSLEVRNRFPNTSLVALQGEITHAGTPFGNAPCADNAVADYLLTGKRPARLPGGGADLTCSKSPDPVPTAAPAPNSAVVKAATRAPAPMRLMVN
jgi:pimeloyl-ACP methyl ester carboxylesterase